MDQTTILFNIIKFHKAPIKSLFKNNNLLKFIVSYCSGNFAYGNKARSLRSAAAAGDDTWYRMWCLINGLYCVGLCSPGSRHWDSMMTRVTCYTCHRHHMCPCPWPGPGQYTGVSACCHISPPATCAAFFLWVSACFTILSSRMNPFPQTSQVNGFSPVCRHMWRLKSVLWLNCLGQTSHL